MTRRISVLMPAVYDELDKELLTGIQTAAASIGFDTLVFTGVSSDNTDSYIQGENNIYALPFLADTDGIILAGNRFSDKTLKADIIRRIEKSRTPFVDIGEDIGRMRLHQRGAFHAAVQGARKHERGRLQKGGQQCVS